MIRPLRIWRLKRKARKAYRAYWVFVEALGCGRDLAEYVSQEALEAKLEFNDAMLELSMIDPNFRGAPL